MGDFSGLCWKSLKQDQVKTEQFSELDWLTLLTAQDGNGLIFSQPVIEVQLSGSDQWQRLYAAPLNLLLKKEGEKETLHFLEIGAPVTCDLGKQVRLPQLSSDAAMGAKPLEGSFITESAYKQVLNGELPSSDHVIQLSDLITHESRLGIALNSAKKTVEEGMLYQTRHIRQIVSEKVHDWRLVVSVNNVPESLANALLEQKTSQCRLGGEARMAAVEISSTVVKPEGDIEVMLTDEPMSRFTLFLETPACYAENDSNELRWLPEGFIYEEVHENTGVSGWYGQINGISLKVESAVIGKAERHGGWDMKKHQPKSVQSYVPSGSIYYCTAQHSIREVYQALNGHHIGNKTSQGYGCIAVGQWRDQ
jgi:CRISPR-associated protein Cmr3